MPNWCSNFATFRHKDPDQLVKMAKAIDDDELFNAFVPMPEELKGTEGLAGNDRELEAKYGASDWYSWAVGNWGTKWDASDAIINYKDDECIELSFETAWSPPEGFYARLMDLGWDVDAYYYEPGMSFCGHWADGCDEAYEIPATSEETRNTIPQDIDDMFAISESQAEYEEQENEELTEWLKEGIEAKKLETA